MLVGYDQSVLQLRVSLDPELAPTIVALRLCAHCLLCILPAYGYANGEMGLCQLCNPHKVQFLHEIDTFNQLHMYVGCHSYGHELCILYNQKLCLLEIDRSFQ